MESLAGQVANNSVRILKIEASQRKLIADLDEFKETVDNGFHMLVAKMDALLQPVEENESQQ